MRIRDSAVCMGVLLLAAGRPGMAGVEAVVLRLEESRCVS
jgi:hypothetical protein